MILTGAGRTPLRDWRCLTLTPPRVLRRAARLRKYALSRTTIPCCVPAILSGSFILATGGRICEFQFPVFTAIEWLGAAHRSQQEERVFDGLRRLCELER